MLKQSEHENDDNYPRAVILKLGYMGIKNGTNTCLKLFSSCFIKPFLLLSMLLMCLPGLAINDEDEQKITLKADNLPLEKVIVEIRKQTGYYFIYESGTLQTMRVTVELKSVSLEEALSKILNGKKLVYKIFDKTVVIKPVEERGKTGATMLSSQNNILNAPPITVKGTVMNSEDQKPVDGATVQVKGTSKATYTNVQGEFTLDYVQDDATLVISRVSYATKEFMLNGNATPVIPLVLDAGKLDEHIITAYSQERKLKETGFSVTIVKGEDLNQSRPTNIISGLAGKVPGLQVNTTTQLGIKPTLKLSLRGIRSLYGNNSPLIVMDGSILNVGGSNTIGASIDVLNLLYTINPADINDLTILRGANATILYGPDGVNGVIIINTKKGSGKAQYNLSQTVTVQYVDGRYPRLQDRFGSGVIQNEFGDGIYDPTTNESWGPEFTGGDSVIGVPDADGNIQKVPYHYTRDRFRFFEPSVTTQTDLSVRAGDSKSSYYLAIQYAKVQGLIPYDESKRITIRFNGEKTYGILKSGININFNRSVDDITASNTFQNVINNPGNIPITQYKDFLNGHWANKFNFYSNDPFRPNPYEDAKLYRSKTNSYTLFGNISFTLTPFNWVSLTNRLGTTFTSNNTESHQSPSLFESFMKNFSNQSGVNNDLLLNFNFEYKNWKIGLLSGASLNLTTLKSLANSFSGLAIPDLFNLGYGAGSPYIEDQNYESRMVSLFSNFRIGFKDFVFGDISYRKQNDSREGNGQTTESYYGANASIVVSDMLPIITETNIFSYLRLRASYNKTANFNFNTYNGQQWFNLINGSSGFPFGNLVSYIQSSVYQNPYTKPEKVFSQEYGAEIRLFNNKINIDIVRYYQKTRDLIQFLVTPPSTGYISINGANSGDFKNMGWEMELNFEPLIKVGNNFAIKATANLSINDNKVISLHQGINELAYGDGYAIVGNAAPLIKIYDYIRDSLSRIIVDPITGRPSVNFSDSKVLGRSLPKYIAGINLNISWSKFLLRIVGEYRGGNYINNKTNSLLFDRLGIASLSALNGRQRFVFPNSVYWDGSKYVPNTNVVLDNAGSSFFNSPDFLFSDANYSNSAAFWKIREVVLSYEFNLSKKVKQVVKGITASIYGRNLFAFYPKNNLWGDPELIQDNFSTRFLGASMSLIF